MMHRNTMIILLTLQVLGCQKNSAQMMALDELTYLRRDFGAFEAHHEELAHGPLLVLVRVLSICSRMSARTILCRPISNRSPC